jgi:hypothetical protein
MNIGQASRRAGGSELIGFLWLQSFGLLFSGVFSAVDEISCSTYFSEHVMFFVTHNVF